VRDGIRLYFAGSTEQILKRPYEWEGGRTERTSFLSRLHSLKE
jgi:hypothetical protein